MNIMIASAVTANSSLEEKAFTKALFNELNRQGHKVDYFFIPVVNEMLSLPEQMILMGMLDVGGEAELLITIGYPAFAIPHKNKVICLFSLISELNEAWDTEYGMIGSPQYYSLKEALRQAESRCFEGAKLLCSSRLLAKDIEERYGLVATVIKLPNVYPFNNVNVESKNSYFICETDLQPISRIETVLDGIKDLPEMINLLIFIPGSKLVYREALEALISRLDLGNRVKIIDGYIDNKILKGATALISIPYKSQREPLAVQAALAEGVPVITTNDSGCLTEIIDSNINGLVVSHEPEDISLAINLLASDVRLRNRMSRKCKKGQNFGNIEEITREICS